MWAPGPVRAGHADSCVSGGVFFWACQYAGSWYLYSCLASPVPKKGVIVLPPKAVPASKQASNANFILPVGNRRCSRDYRR